MYNPRSIWAKALLMLVVFTASFTVFCHCATAQKHSCCCEKKTKPCHSAESVKFNLAEKQLADHIQAAPLAIMAIVIRHPLAQPAKLPTPATLNRAKHPPPDLLTIQQRLLI
ncbi:MAG TPA: hypothetical protein VNW04_07575 [Puia sp.]|jgi:hypothetical protein|nr:hypothetical protein [Puia sp.]